MSEEIELTEIAVQVPVQLRITIALDVAQGMSKKDLARKCDRMIDEIAEKVGQLADGTAVCSVSAFWDALPTDEVNLVECEEGLFEDDDE
jgi:hypothetical protein